MARIFRQSSCKRAIESNKTKTKDMLLGNCAPPVLTMIRCTSPSKIKSMATDRTTATSPQRRPMSAFEARVSLVLALASQASYQSQRLLFDLANETTKYLFPKRSGSRDLEEALMAVPDLETLKYKVSSRKEGYEIREVEPYFVAETTMSGETGFDFYGASQSFNVLAEYLFGKVEHDEGENGNDYACYYSQDPARDDQRGKWRMSLVMPSKYGANLPLPKDPSVRVEEVPGRVVAVVAFSGFVTDEEVKQRELKLRDALKKDPEFRVKESASVEVAQYNPPFTLPFTRRNEIALEVERKED